MANESSLPDLLLKVRRGLAETARSRERVKSTMGNLRQAVDTLDMQARGALAQGRQDLAREALTRKAAFQAKLSEMETEFRRRVVLKLRLDHAIAVWNDDPDAPQ